jgi:hypothetical protein
MKEVRDPSRIAPVKGHPVPRTSLRRRLLAGAGALLAPVLVLSSPHAATAAETRDRAAAAAGWLGRQLDRDSHLVVGSFGPDYGQTADVVLALDAAGVGGKAARQATTALRRAVPDYTGGGDPAESYAGAFAKLLVVAAAQRVSPRRFGGSDRRNLVKALRALECGGASRTDCPAADRGRFSDRSAFGDFSNAITQSLAVIGLERATKPGVSRAAVRYLRSQQCGNGAFPLTFGSVACVGSVDATGFAVQALLLAGGGSNRDAAGDAGRWLARRQHGNGSFSGNGTRNANSTALAAQAFDALGRGGDAREARGFLRSLQVGCDGERTERGSVLYNRAGTGEALRATTQAAPALAGVTLGEVTGDGSRRGLPRLAC